MRTRRTNRSIPGAAGGALQAFPGLPLPGSLTHRADSLADQARSSALLEDVLARVALVSSQLQYLHQRMDDEPLSIAEFADERGVSVQVVYQWIEAGEVEPIGNTKPFRIRRSEIEWRWADVERAAQTHKLSPDQVLAHAIHTRKGLHGRLQARVPRYLFP